MHDIWLTLSIENDHYELHIDNEVKVLPIQNIVFDSGSARGKLFHFLGYLLDNKLPAAQYIADYYRCRRENYLCVVYDFKEIIKELLPEEIDDNPFVRELLPCINRIMEPNEPKDFF